MKQALTTLFWLSTVTFLCAQAPFTQKQYGFRLETNLIYGVADNYAGIPTTLILDLYKPVGDDNTQRPLIVFVHGGSWLGGCKNAAATFGPEMAQRGYVVASVNYRLGWHKSGGPIPNPVADGTLYAADSSELIRALYRGQQDVKGAIRWLKARAALDSTCSERVLVGGESAGGFIALAVGFLDREAEKPSSCMALTAAPTPAANLTNSYDLNCVTQTINPSGPALQRPDLGSVDGPLNLNGHDANVLGVINFFGGVPLEASEKNWLQGPDTPAVYLYHQTCDGVVPFGGGSPFFVISNYCNLGFTPWHTNYMRTFGSGSLAAAFEVSNVPYTTDFDVCPDFNPNLALFECIRYNDNGAYHYTANPVSRAQKVANYFSPLIIAGNCYTVDSKTPLHTLNAVVSPNPFQQNLSVWLEKSFEGMAQLEIRDVSGRMVWSNQRNLVAGENRLLTQNDLPAGLYVLQIRTSQALGVWKLLRQ